MNYIKILLFFLAILFLSGLVYTFLNDKYYISDINYSQYTFAYKIIFSTLLLITIIIFYLNKNIQLYFIIIFVSITTALYLFEFYSNSSSNIYTNNKENNDNRNLKDVIKDFEKKKIKAVQTISPANFQKSDGIILKNSNKIYPLAGISNIITPLCNETGKWSIYKSDKYGFNNNNEIWDKDVDYLIIGDSFAHGACVDRQDDFRGKLMKYSNKNAITLGYGGNGPLTALASYREYNGLVKPKIIIWMYFELSDLPDLQKEFTYSEILRGYLNAEFTQDLYKYPLQIDEALTEYLYKKKLSKFIKLQNTRKAIRSHINSLRSKKVKKINNENLLSQNSTKKDITDKKYLDLFFNILNKANEEIKSNNQELVFLYLPFLRIDDPNDKNNKINYFKKEILNELDDMKIRYIDIDEMVIKKIEEPVDLIGVHFNEKIYDLMAKKYLELINN